ncbi:hypothetical protein [Mycobacterium sp. URHB0021]
MTSSTTQFRLTPKARGAAGSEVVTDWQYKRFNGIISLSVAQAGGSIVRDWPQLGAGSGSAGEHVDRQDGAGSLGAGWSIADRSGVQIAAVETSSTGPATPALAGLEDTAPVDDDMAVRGVAERNARVFAWLSTPAALTRRPSMRGLGTMTHPLA